MGLLDGLFGNQSSGGLLDYLNSYLNPQSPQTPQPMSNSSDLTPTERKLMGLVQPSGAQPPIADFADRFNAIPGAPQPFIPSGRTFDNKIFNPNTYGVPPTFADRFNAMPGAPQPFTGAGRQFDASTFDPSTFNPQQKLRDAMAPQASPIAVGNYMMPRVGMASAYQSDPAALPPTSQPTQGQMPQMPSQAESLPPALGGQPGGFLGGLNRGLQSIGNGGSVLGALTGNFTDPQSMAQQNLKAQYDSLVPVLGPQKALLAVMNPEAGKTLLNEALTNKEQFKTIKDGMGREVPVFVNEREQTINGKPIAQFNSSSSAGGLEALQRAQDAGITGDALYGYLPKEIAPTVKAMIEGRQPLPSTTAMRSPATLAMIDAAHTIDPTFDATTWKARQAGQVDFASGKSSEMVRSANQTLHHVGQLLDAMDNLKNGRFPMANAVGNYVGEATGSGTQGAFRTNAHAVAEELSKVFKGSNLSDSEIRAWEQNLNENMSPEQQKAQILKLRDLLQGSLHALDEKRTASIGPMAAAKAGPIIKEEGQRVLERIDKWANGQGAATPTVSDGMTATNPQTGAKVVFKGGKWVPMQ